ncbi:hypothetical protein HWV62_12783 [Athelia sp. TMB]|nr:hypothetical protein HWV62_12783 [Athelia sp. TMB]
MSRHKPLPLNLQHQQHSASDDKSTHPTSPPPSSHAAPDDDLTPFAALSKSLAAIGALSIEDYLRLPEEPPKPAIQYFTGLPPEMLLTPPTPQPREAPSDAPPKTHYIAQLHQACQRAFGKTDMLQFTFEERDGPSSASRPHPRPPAESHSTHSCAAAKRCILTIAHPGGAVRTYASPETFPRKNEAKAQTAALAVEAGALEFIAAGAGAAKPGVVLAALDAPAEDAAPLEPTEESLVREIEDACTRWWGGRRPYWATFSDPKAGTKVGCALRVQLTPRYLRVYASAGLCDTLQEAKCACARAAHEQGVIEFIEAGASQAAALGPRNEPQAGHPQPISLQDFFDEFPQPFYEDLGGKSLSEFNAPSWLNTTVQTARGAKLTTTFHWTANANFFGGNAGLHGCLLRIERPGELKAYLVDTRFVKRADAKAAVCLQAMSQGVGDYIRDISHHLDGKVTKRMKDWGNEVVSILTAEYGKIRPGMLPRFDFEKDVDAYGCSIIIELSSPPTAEDTRTYTVPTEYRTKADAKMAVACLAAEQGVVEFVRFRGGPVPPHYQSFHSELQSGTLDALHKLKRKHGDGAGPQDRKRPRMSSMPRAANDNPPLLETKEEAIARLHGRQPPAGIRVYQSHPGDKKRGDRGWNRRGSMKGGGSGGHPRPAQGMRAGHGDSGPSGSALPRANAGGPSVALNSRALAPGLPGRSAIMPLHQQLPLQSMHSSAPPRPPQYVPPSGPTMQPPLSMYPPPMDMYHGPPAQEYTPYHGLPYEYPQHPQPLSHAPSGSMYPAQSYQPSQPHGNMQFAAPPYNSYPGAHY